jgi:hypothetical protein
MVSILNRRRFKYVFEKKTRLTSTATEISLDNLPQTDILEWELIYENATSHTPSMRLNDLATAIYDFFIWSSSGTSSGASATAANLAAAGGTGREIHMVGFVRNLKNMLDASRVIDWEYYNEGVFLTKGTGKAATTDVINKISVLVSAGVMIANSVLVVRGYNVS